MSVDSDISSLLDELHQTKELGNLLAKPSPPPVAADVITDDNVNDYILKQASHAINQGMAMLAQLQMGVTASGSAEEIEAYSKLFSAVTGSIDTLNKVNLQNKKARTSKELKQIEAEIRSSLPNQGNTTNIIVAPREEIMERLFNRAEEIVDVTPEDTVD